MLLGAIHIYEKMFNLLEQANAEDNPHKIRTIILDAIKKIKTHISELPEIDHTTEIQLNKEIIPHFYAELISNDEKSRIISDTKHLTGESLQQYYQTEIEKISKFYYSKRKIIRYFFCGSTFNDHIYFVKSAQPQKHFTTKQYTPKYPIIGTPYSQDIGVAIAFEQLQNFLYAEMLSLKELPFTPSAIKKLLWTDSKTALVELIYAIYASCSINNGKVNLTDIARFAENHLGVSLGNITVTFQEILGRKDEFAFLDKLKTNLSHYVNEIDKKNIK